METAKRVRDAMCTKISYLSPSLYELLIHASPPQGYHTFGLRNLPLARREPNNIGNKVGWEIGSSGHAEMILRTSD